MGISDRISGYVGRHRFVSAVGGVAVLGVLVAVDVARLWRAYHVMGSTVQRPLALGLVLAVGSVAWLGWLVRHWSAFPQTKRSLWRNVLIAWGGITLIAFALTHSRGSGDDTPATSPAVAAVVYLATLAAGGVVAAPLVVWRRSAEALPREHQVNDLVEVWHVRDRSRGKTDEPYVVAYCECGWVGDAHDETDPQAEPKAFADARRHGSNVASDVAYPLD
jgi:hypothetical protein